jgi:adenylate cyclase
MPPVRRLTAILAADVAGYSRLMGADEEGTHERLKAHLSQMVNPKIKEHRGRIVKNTGDGMLAEFFSVVDAVRCAAEVQRGMADRNANTPEDKRITFRIGINLGYVIAEPDDIYGDGVNVAARLEALAEPGGICVSRVVRDQIRDKLPYPFEDKGDQTVKNIARSVRVYALRPEAVAELPAAGVSVGARQRRRANRRANLSYWRVRPTPLSLPKDISCGRSIGLADSRRFPGNCEPPPVSRGCGEIKIELRRRANCSDRFTAVLPKVSTRQICEKLAKNI